MKLVLLVPSVRWFVAYDGAWFRLEERAGIDLAASVLPLETVDEHGLIEQPHQRGRASVTPDPPRAGQPGSVTFAFDELDGTRLDPVPLVIDERVLMHLEWLDRPYRDGWTPADARLRVEGTSRLVLRAYLPPAPDGVAGDGVKRLVVEDLTHGSIREVRLARGADTDIALVDGAFDGQRTLRLRCEPETVTGSTDARQLGFLLVDTCTGAAPGAGRPPEGLRRERLERNLQASAAGAGALAAARAERLRSAMDERAGQHREETSPTPAPGNGARPRAAVVCWDLGHNPAGRAHVLCTLLQQDHEVDLVGPLWTRYGGTLWAPLAGEGLNVRTFRCNDIDDFVPQAELLAVARRYDLVHVCKPRLPSLYLGALIARGSGCPMIVDVDDHELSFFGRRDAATLDEVRQDAARALVEPHEELATRYAQSLIGRADAVTVSNVALRETFGGHLVRHARDGQRFRIDADARTAARARLGIGDDDYALMFIGTPRPHKGIGEVARALHELDDPALVFHIVGTLADPALRSDIEACTRARVVLHADCAFDELPRLLAAADLVPLIQDPQHPVSRYQMPAKVSDALALGVPVLASSTPPLADLIAQGAITPVGTAGLAASIRALHRESVSRPVAAARARRAFLGELGVPVNRARLAGAIDEARERAPDTEGAWEDTIALMRDEYARRRRRALADGSPMTAPARAKALAGVPGTRRSGIVSLGSRLGRTVGRTVGRTMDRSTVRHPAPGSRGAGAGYDIAFFWKQNDSNLYGRRADMVARHLAASDRVNRVVHFDAPLQASALEQHFGAGGEPPGGEQGLIARNLFDRCAGLHDSERLRQRTFIAADARSGTRWLDERLPERRDYPRWVREQLVSTGMRPERTWAWFCPVIRDAPALVERLGFAGVVSDLIDDERAWGGDAAALEASYRDTLALSDVTFANCDALARAMQGHAGPITVVPNGAERFLQADQPPVPQPLADIDGPVAGYVGNLRDRIDWLLLQDVAGAMPHVTFVLAGPTGESANAHTLAAYPNVRLPGPVPYRQLPAWLRRFDVGLLPHLDNRLTARMNPLKVYNYFACGLPIVSTPVGGLGALGDAVRTASDAAGFVQAIDAALRAPPDTSSMEWKRTMDSIAWDTRTATMLDTLDACAGARLFRAG